MESGHREPTWGDEIGVQRGASGQGRARSCGNLPRGDTAVFFLPPSKGPESQHIPAPTQPTREPPSLCNLI